MGISASGGGLKIGDIRIWSAAAIPADSLECYGQAVSRATYAALFAVVGTVYGVGDGSTTFNLPDLRGRGLFGKDNMGGSAANRLTTGGGGVDGVTLGAVGGGQSVTLTTAQLAAHTHAETYGTISGSTGLSGGFTSSPQSSALNTQSAGSGSAHQNIPPALVVNFIIKVY